MNSDFMYKNHPIYRVGGYLRWSLLALMWLIAFILMIHAAKYDSPIIGEPSGPLFHVYGFYLRHISILFTLLFSYLYYRWVKKFLGSWWALFPLSLFLFTPYYLGIGHYFSLEIVELLSILAATMAFLSFLHKPTRSALLAGGLTLGIAGTVSFQALALVPLFFIVLFLYYAISLARDWGSTRPGKHIRRFGIRAFRFLRAFILQIVIALSVTWVVYQVFGWSFQSRFLEGAKAYTNYLLSPPRWHSTPATQLINDLSLTLVFVLMGVFLVFGTVRLWRGIRTRHFGVNEFLNMYFTEIASLIFGLLLMCASRNIFLGLPFFYFTLGLIVKNTLLRKPVTQSYNLMTKLINAYHHFGRTLLKTTLVGLFVALYLIITLVRSPLFLEEDRGQDLGRLALWTEENNIEKIAVDYAGTGSLKFYFGDIAERWWSARNNPKNEGIRWLAVSGTKLHNPIGSLEDTYAWLGTKESPYTKIGHTIHVYQLR